MEAIDGQGVQWTDIYLRVAADLPLPEVKLGMEAWLAVHLQLVNVPRIAATMDTPKPGQKRFSQISVG